ncbi:hypothetical protein MYSE111917_27465 [Mycobacterium senriense]
MRGAPSFAFAAANEAPRARAISGSSGVVTDRAVAASSVGLIDGMSTSEPTRNTPSALIDSAPETIEVSFASAASSLPGSACRCTSVTLPLEVSTTASVALPGSTSSNAVRAQLVALPMACASAAAAMTAETSITFSILRAANTSRSAAALTGSVQLTPLDRSRYPPWAALSRVPRMAETT